MRIGIFDSGLGGINVLKEMIKVHPYESYIYIGDNKNVPYGNKSIDELYTLSTKIIDKLIEFDVDIVIVACGTISSNVYEKLQNYCSVPIVNIVATTIDCINKLKIDSIAVMATPNTIKSHIFKKNLKSEEVYEVECKDLASIIENNTTNETKKIYIEKIKESVVEIDKLRDIDTITNHFTDSEYISKSYLSDVDTSSGIVTLTLEAPDGLYNKVLKDIIGVDVTNKADLLKLFQDYNEAKTEYDQIKGALKMVKQTGYGVASPSLSDMKLDTPEIIKQGSRYGIKLKAVAPSIHMIRVDVESTFEPIIGSELQSKELIDYLMKDSETEEIWKSEIFGRSLDVIVKEGIQAKLSLLPENARFKLQQTLSKLVNKGSGNLFAIVL